MNPQTQQVATREDIDRYLDHQENDFPYHDKAIREDIVSNLRGHYPGDFRYIEHGDEGQRKKTSTYNITNYRGLVGLPEYSNDISLMKLLHHEMGLDPKLMDKENEIYQLTNAGISRINNVFNEMESHYLLYKPALQSTITHFLRKNNIAQIITKKNITVKGESTEYEGLKLDKDPVMATKQMLDFIKALTLLEEVPTNRTRNNILGHYLQFFRRRLHMDLSDVYQKRNGLFELIGDNILSSDRRIIYDDNALDIKRKHSNTEYSDSQYTLKTNFTLLNNGEQIRCTLHGRTKSAKSINDKLESNSNYDYLDAMDDLFAYTITTEHQKDLGLVTGIIMSQLLSKRISTMENNIDALKISDKGGMLTDQMKGQIKKMLGSIEKQVIFDNKTQDKVKGKTKKLVTSSSYQDMKAQTSLTNVDGHPCGCEIKFMTHEQFEKSEKDDEGGTVVYKIKDKLKKEGRYEKLLPAQYVSKFTRKLENSKEFRGQAINTKKIKEYVKQALHCVSYHYQGKTYVGYVAKDYLQYHKEQELLGIDVKIIDWISPETLMSKSKIKQYILE